MSLQQTLSNHIDSHKTHGVAWPNDAEYAVVTASACWPTFWSTADTVIHFVSDEGALQKVLSEQDEWQKLEDNYLVRRVYRWDLGPVEMPEHAVGDGYRLNRQASLV